MASHETDANCTEIKETSSKAIIEYNSPVPSSSDSESCYSSKTQRKKRSNCSHSQDYKNEGGRKRLCCGGGKDRSGIARRLWTQEEDEAITSLVKLHGIRQWALISKRISEVYHIKGRSGKQCRERYS